MDQIHNPFVIIDEKNSTNNKYYVYHVDIKNILNKNNNNKIEYGYKFSGGYIDVWSLLLIITENEINNDWDAARYKIVTSIAQFMYDDRNVCVFYKYIYIYIYINNKRNNI